MIIDGLKYSLIKCRLTSEKAKEVAREHQYSSATSKVVIVKNKKNKTYSVYKRR